MNLTKLHQYMTPQFAEIRAAIEPIVDGLSEPPDTAVNLTRFVKLLSDATKKYRVNFISVKTDEDEDEHCPLIGGSCYPATKTLLPLITVVVYYSKGRLKLDSPNWNVMKYKLFETILHELVHRAQYCVSNSERTDCLVFQPTSKKLKKDELENQRYLGEIDEVEAYAHDVVQYWNYVKPEVPLTRRRLNAEFSYETNIHALQFYYDAFKDISHPAVKRLFNKVLQWKTLVTPLAAGFPESPTTIRNFRRIVPVTL